MFLIFVFITYLLNFDEKKFTVKKMQGVTSLPHARIHEKEETKRLNNLPNNFVETFYNNWVDGINFSRDTDFQQKILKNTPSEDVKKYLLATSEFGQEIQREIDSHITNKKLNKASFRRKLDTISRNIIKNQNPVELLFKDIKHFDAQYARIGSLIQEVDIQKRKVLSKFLAKAPDIRDLAIRPKLNKLHEKDAFFNKGNGNNNNNNNNNFFYDLPISSSQTDNIFSVSLLTPAPSLRLKRQNDVGTNNPNVIRQLPDW